jgi:uncharacterized membrane protein
MNKSTKPVLLYSIVLLITISSFTVLTVITKISYEQLLMKKDSSNNELTVALQEQRKLNVIYQDLTSEDNIVPYAENVLMLRRNFRSVAQVKISEERLQFLEEALQMKHE